jgi:hypothetical protein
MREGDENNWITTFLVVAVKAMHDVKQTDTLPITWRDLENHGRSQF